MNSWGEISQPALGKLGYTSRKQQSLLGEKIISTLESRGHVVIEAATGTGKSLGILIPMLAKMSEDPEYRGVICTPTKALQDQYKTDMDSLQELYKCIKWADLKGKDNYLCINRLKDSKGKLEDFTYQKVSEMIPTLFCGERSEVEENLRFRLSDTEWWQMCGESKRCGEGRCKPETCFGVKAVTKAKSSQLIITNSAMLCVDSKIRNTRDSEEGLLGRLDTICVDEAHLLENDFISGYTEEISEYDLHDYIRKIRNGLSVVHTSPKSWEEQAEEFTDLVRLLKLFYMEREETPSGESVIHQNYLNGDEPKKLITALLDYEDKLDVLENTDSILKAVESKIRAGMEETDSSKATRTLQKALTACHSLSYLLLALQKAFTKDSGTFYLSGTPFNLVAAYYPSKGGMDSRIKFKITPLDISKELEVMWSGRACVLMSATLQDISTGSFQYIKQSLGFPIESEELVLGTVFDLFNQQVFYLTQGQEAGPVLDSPGAQFSYEEMRELLLASKGRSLVLFTSLRELKAVQEKLLLDPLPYPTYFQTNGENKEELTKHFRNEVDSVLFCSRTFFQGVSFAGETLSQVILVKTPLLSYNELTQNMEKWWRSRGFPQWYNSRSLFDLQQAVGRGVRTETDKVIISLLDHRLLNTRSRVHRMTQQLITSTGSGSMSSIEYVERFLG